MRGATFGPGRAIAPTAALILALAGCSSPPEAPPRPWPTSTPPDVTYTIDITPESNSLTWDYEVRNDGATVLAVVNGPDPSAPDEEPPVWVVNAGGGTVEVSQRLHDQPEGLLLEEPIRAGASILRPGESLTGSATVPLALQLHHPHVRADDLESYPGYAVPDDPTDVVFCLGVLEIAPDRDEAWPFTHDGMARGQHLLCSEPHTLTDAPD